MTKSTLERLTDIIDEVMVVDREKITPGAVLIDDLGADSLDTIEIVMDAEREFDIVISDDEAENWLTVGDYVAGIDRLVAAKAVAA